VWLRLLSLICGGRRFERGRPSLLLQVAHPLLLLLRRRGSPGGRTRLGRRLVLPHCLGAQAAAPHEDESQTDVGKLRSQACPPPCGKRMFHVFHTFVNDVASVLMDVEKVDLDVSMLRDVAYVFLNVSDVVFECCRCYF
jgi:hypothetical protein